MDEEAALAVTARGASNVKHLVAGHKLKLKRHFSSDGEYVLAAVTHQASFGADYRSGKDANLTYQNVFTCFPAALPFRPKRLTTKPVVQGSQTAVVVGPKGEEIFTDKYGRVKVQFHWDRKGKNNEDSSCWVRVGQMAAGRRWGSSYWPRIGQEVIVDFLEGDPDQPIVVGTVYNADQMPPYLGQGPDGKHKNDNKVSGLKTNSTKGGAGFNELRFDDSKDKQQVFVHAERNMDVRVKKDSMESVLEDKHVTVGQEKDGEKKGEYREHVFKDKHVAVDGVLQARYGDAKVLVGGGDENGDLDVYVEGDMKTTVDGSQDLHVKRRLVADVDQYVTVNLGQGLALKVRRDVSVDAEGRISLRAGGHFQLDAAEGFCLKGPGGFVRVTQDGVFIVGDQIHLNSGGTPLSGGVIRNLGAEDAEKAGPAAPTAADDAKTGQKSC